MNSPEARELLREIRELRELLTGLPARIAAAVGRDRRSLKPLSRADVDALAILLPLIDAGLPNITFSVRLLGKYAALEDAPYIALRSALASIGGPLKIGRLLRRCTGHTVAGFKIEESGRDRDGVLRVLRTATKKTRKTHTRA